MYKDVKLLTKDDTNLKVKVIENFEYSKELTHCVLTVDEFFKAVKSQPIVFTKNIDGNYLVSALLGIKKDTNNFLNEKFEWKEGEYIPAYVRRYPFIVVQDKENFSLAYDAKCKAINTKEGQSLLGTDGKQTEYAKGVMDFMENFHTSSLRTLAFVHKVSELDLLEDANIEMTVKGQKFAFNGFKRINEEKLNALDDDKTMELIKNGYYKLIVAHLISMSNFKKLIALEN